MIRSSDLILVHQSDGTFYKADFEDYHFYLNSKTEDYKVYYLPTENVTIPEPKNMNLMSAIEKLFTNSRYTVLIPYMETLIPLLTQSYIQYKHTLIRISDAIYDAANRGEIKLTHNSSTETDMIEMTLFIPFILSKDALKYIVE